MLCQIVRKRTFSRRRLTKDDHVDNQDDESDYSAAGSVLPRIFLDSLGGEGCSEGESEEEELKEELLEHGCLGRFFGSREYGIVI